VFFWGLLAVALVLFVAVFAYGARGMGQREHKPGTTRLR
jgi:hypothetical protein